MMVRYFAGQFSTRAPGLLGRLVDFLQERAASDNCHDLQFAPKPRPVYSRDVLQSGLIFTCQLSAPKLMSESATQARSLKRVPIREVGHELKGFGRDRLEL